MKRLRPRQEHVQKEVRKAMDYFQTNKERMRYAQFRSQGLFVGWGVVEAGCKTIIGQRLKQSGIRWTVNHANAIIALRCPSSVAVGKNSGNNAPLADIRPVFHL